VRYLIYISVALVTFFIGVLLVRAFEPNEITPIAQSQDDDLHKLYEAASMLGNDELRNEVLDRFQCLSTENYLNARMVTTEWTVYCVNSKREYSLAYIQHDSDYEKLRRSHGEWTWRNIEFLKSISSKNKARQYVIAHLPEYY